MENELDLSISNSLDEIYWRKQEILDFQEAIHFLDEINFHPLQYYLVEEKRHNLIGEIHQLDMKIRQRNDDLSTLTTKSINEAIIVGIGIFFRIFPWLKIAKSKS